jgi:putative FmdB family regulatory protein
MPKYDYKCQNKKCPNKTKEIELSCKMDERDKQECPKCKKPLKRLLSKANLNWM